MKIVLTDMATVTAGDLSFDCLREFGDITVYPMLDPVRDGALLASAEAVLCNKTEMNAAALQQAPKLKYIGVFATGYNNIDLTEAKKRHITVCNVPGYSTEAVAQHTWALLLRLVDRVGEFNQIVKEHDEAFYRSFANFPHPAMELCGKTIGLIGYGAIGRRVGEIAHAFGMRVLAYTRHGVQDGMAEGVPLDTLLAQSDVVSLHCPLNEDSRDLICARTIEKMKDGALLINTARGGIVVEEDLYRALLTGKLGGAGLDVVRSEPIDNNCILWQAPHCIITPHVAWTSLQTRQRLLQTVYENLRAFCNGKPQNVVE